MTRKASKEVTHDPFHDPAPQVSNVYEYEEPEELSHFDHSKGGQNVKPVVITDEHFDSNFVPPNEPHYDFSSKRRK